MNKTNISLVQNFQENNANVRMDEFVMQMLFSFVHSAYYYYGAGGLYNRTFSGGFWENKKYSKYDASYLDFAPSSIRPQKNQPTGTGFSVRCVTKFFR